MSCCLVLCLLLYEAWSAKLEKPLRAHVNVDVQLSASSTAKHAVGTRGSRHLIRSEACPFQCRTHDEEKVQDSRFPAKFFAEAVFAYAEIANADDLLTLRLQKQKDYKAHGFEHPLAADSLEFLDEYMVEVPLARPRDFTPAFTVIGGVKMSQLSSGLLPQSWQSRTKKQGPHNQSSAGDASAEGIHTIPGDPHVLSAAQWRELALDIAVFVEMQKTFAVLFAVRAMWVSLQGLSACAVRGLRSSLHLEMKALQSAVSQLMNGKSVSWSLAWPLVQDRSIILRQRLRDMNGMVKSSKSCQISLQAGVIDSWYQPLFQNGHTRGRSIRFNSSMSLLQGKGSWMSKVGLSLTLACPKDCNLTDSFENTRIAWKDTSVSYGQFVQQWIRNYSFVEVQVAMNRTLSLGRLLGHSHRPRQDFFVTAQVLPGSRDGPIHLVEQLKALETDYVDVLLQSDGKFDSEAWRQLEAVVDVGNARALGITGVENAELASACVQGGRCKHAPTFVEVDWHLCSPNGLRSLGPLTLQQNASMIGVSAGSSCHKEPLVGMLAAHRGVSIEAMMLQWSLQAGVPVLMDPSMMMELMQSDAILGLELSEAEMSMMSILPVLYHFGEVKGALPGSRLEDLVFQALDEKPN